MKELKVTPVETASPMQRWTFSPYFPAEMVKQDDGEWVRFKDAESQLTQVRSELDKTELDMVYWLRRGRAAEEKGEKLELALTQVREEHRIARNEVL